MSAFETGLEAIVLLVLGGELAFGQAFLMDMLRMQRGPAGGSSRAASRVRVASDCSGRLLF